LKTPWKKPVEYSWSLHSAGHIGALSCYSEIRFSSFLAWSPCPKISAEMGPWSSTAWLFSLFSYEYENLPRMIITMGKGNPFFPQKKEWPAHGAGSLTHLALVLAGLLSHPLRSPRQILLSVASVVTCWNPRLAICWGKERRLERKENSDHQTWIPHLSEFPEKKQRKNGDLMSCQLRFHRCLPSNYCTLPYLDVTIDQTSKKSPPFPTLSMCSASTSQCH
jgi:hypothetical protein